MSKTLPVLAATLLPLLLAAPVAAAAPAADDDRRDLRPAVRLTDEDSEVSLLACREPALQGRAWRVFLRLDNSAGDGRATGSIAVKRDGRLVGRGTTGWVRDGEVSTTFSFRAPRTKDLTVRTALRTDHRGGIGIGPLDLERC